MADINFFKVSSMPTPAVANSVYFVKSGTSTKIYVTDTTGTPVGVNSVDAVVNSVNGLNGNVQLELSLSGGSLSITGGTTPVNLDNRYLKTTDNISWSKITGQPTTLGGYGITDAYTKSEVTAITGSLSNLNTSTKASLVAAINELNTALADQLDVPNPIDCSTNPNYPASSKGDTYKVTAAGKIGGANGVNVGVGDLIICTANTSGGDQATAGDNFFVVESNVDMATESVAGIGKIATQAQVDAGTDDKAWVTPKTLTQNLNGKGFLTSEADPLYSADKVDIFMNRGNVPTGTDMGTFLTSGAFYHGSGSTGTTNDPYATDYSIFNIGSLGFRLRFASAGSSATPKLQWGIPSSFSAWKNMIVEGGNISQLNNDSGYLTNNDATLQKVTENGSTTDQYSNFSKGLGIGRRSILSPADVDDYTSGILIKTSIPENLNVGFYLEISSGGNSSYVSRMYISGYRVSGASNIASLNALTTNPEFVSATGMILDGFLCFWVEVDYTNISTAPEVQLYTSYNSQEFSITSIENAVEPTTHTVYLNVDAKVIANQEWVNSNYLSSSSPAGGITSTDISDWDAAATDAHDALTLGTNKNGLSLNGQELSLALATTSAAGAMSSADKTKLNGIATNANNYTLPKASASTLGGIKVGNNLSIDANGVLSASDSTYSAGVGLDLDAGEFSLLPATAAALGGVKVGTRLSITAQGTLSADKQMVWAAPPEW